MTRRTALTGKRCIIEKTSRVFSLVRCHEACHVGRFQWPCRPRVGDDSICRDRNQCVKLRDIVAVGPDEDYPERDAPRFDIVVVLWTRSRAAVGCGPVLDLHLSRRSRRIYDDTDPVNTVALAQSREQDFVQREGQKISGSHPDPRFATA
jgi:hypothetical protein